eukprot:649891-Amorphochlora_amoeboformis.AAC.1
MLHQRRGKSQRKRNLEAKGGGERRTGEGRDRQSERDRRKGWVWKEKENTAEGIERRTKRASDGCIQRAVIKNADDLVRVRLIVRVKGTVWARVRHTLGKP